MTRNELIDTITTLIQDYIGAPAAFDSDPQLRVNPATLQVRIINGKEMLEEIALSDATIEGAASVDGDAAEAAGDYQSAQNPDFYPVRTLIKAMTPTIKVPDSEAITKVVETYI